MRHEYYMKKAIMLAEMGRQKVSPNPLVGAVIVKENRVIGQGYHEYYGGNHAEVNALKDCSENPKGSVMYVTLEPCNHIGKTPPCTKAIIAAGIKEVYIGLNDINPVASGGIETLENAGIVVNLGLLKKEITKQNKAYIKSIKHQLPYCTVKYAMTLDGKMAADSGDSKWITSEKSREFSHQLRQEHQAILVGINTVINDNPRLTTRLKDKIGKDCLRIIVDSYADISVHSNVLQDNNCLLAITKYADKDNVQHLINIGIDVLVCDSVNGFVDIKDLFLKLVQRGIVSVLVEGGPQIITSVIKSKLCDKVVSFIAPKIIGGSKYTPIRDLGINKMLDAIVLSSVEHLTFENDIAIVGYLEEV